MDPKRNIKGLKLTLGKKKITKITKNMKNITEKYNCFHSQILLNDFGFGDFSTHPRHVERCGRIPNPSKGSPGGLWKRLIDFFTHLSQGSP